MAAGQILTHLWKAGNVKEAEVGQCGPEGGEEWEETAVFIVHRLVLLDIFKESII